MHERNNTNEVVCLDLPPRYTARGTYSRPEK
jgi:hypothetical protein